MLVVIDTSTLISGVLWTGLPHRLIELAEAGQITLCATEEMLVELREVLSRSKFATKIRDRFTSVEEIMQSILALVALYPVLPSSGLVQADPGDDKIVACALAAGAEYLISSDEHLLDLKSVGDVRILTAREFLAERFPSAL
jgi:putative PIN family toxin of toxin-antitoxin system